MSSRPGFENIQSSSGSGFSVADEGNSSIFNLDPKPETPITITINAPSGLTPPTTKPKEEPMDGKIVTMKNPYTSVTTGYDINRELYS